MIKSEICIEENMMTKEHGFLSKIWINKNIASTKHSSTGSGLDVESGQSVAGISCLSMYQVSARQKLHDFFSSCFLILNFILLY